MDFFGVVISNRWSKPFERDVRSRPEMWSADRLRHLNISTVTWNRYRRNSIHGYRLVKWWILGWQNRTAIPAMNFLWILPFVFLRYQDWKSQLGTRVGVWMTSDYVTCREKKNYFRWIDVLNKNGKLCQLDLRDHWMLAKELLLWWAQWLNITKRPLDKKGRDLYRGWK